MPVALPQYIIKNRRDNIASIVPPPFLWITAEPGTHPCTEEVHSHTYYLQNPVLLCLS